MRRLLAAFFLLLLTAQAAGQGIIVIRRAGGAGPTCADLTADANLQAWYQLEEDNSPADESRADSSGKGNTLNASGVESSASVFKQGARASDSTDASGSLSIADLSLSANFPGQETSGTTAMAVSTWAYVQSGTAPNIVGKGMNGTASLRQYRIAITTGPKFRAELINASGTSFLADANSNLSYNTWYHVGLDWDGSALRLYINGAAQTDTESVTSLNHIPGLVMLYGSWSSTYDGYNDETAFFNRSLSADEWSCIHSDGLDAGGYP